MSYTIFLAIDVLNFCFYTHPIVGYSILEVLLFCEILWDPSITGALLISAVLVLLEIQYTSRIYHACFVVCRNYETISMPLISHCLSHIC